jgi:hypothetical protein
MRLRILFTLGLVLFLRTLASSNECAWHCPRQATVQPAHPANAASGEYSTLLVNKLLYI